MKIRFAIKDIMFQTYQTVSDFLSEKNFIKKFLLSFGIYFLAFFSLIQADYLYWDDMKRVHGIQNYATASRPLNEFLVRLMFFDIHTHDISPITHLFSFIFLALASLLLVKIVSKEITYKRVLLSCTLGLSPYFLQNISYKFDCMFMSLSLVCAIYPFLFFKNQKLFRIHCVLGLILTMTTYQVSVSVWLMLFFYLLFREEVLCTEISYKKFFKTSFVSLLLFSSICVATFVITNHFNDNGWVRSHSRLCDLSDCPHIILTNFNILTDYIFAHWSSSVLSYFLIALLVVFILHLSILSLKARNDFSKTDNLLLGLGTVSLILFSVIAWTLFFTKLVLEPRILIGFGCAVSLMLLDCSLISYKRLKPLVSILSIIIFWQFFIFVARYGNLLTAQQQYETYFFSRLATQIDEHNIKQLYIKPGKLQSPLVKIKSDKSPLYNHLVFFHLEQPSWPYDYLNVLMGSDIRSCTDRSQTQRVVLYTSSLFSLTKINNTCVQVDFFK